MQTIETDIVIAGGGPTGLALACALSGTGLEIVLVDAGKNAVSFNEIAENADKTPFDARVSALTVASQKLLIDLGVWDQIRAVRVCPYHDMHVWDGEGTGSIRFSAADIHADCLGNIVENNLVAAALLQKTRSNPRLTLLQEAQVEQIQPDTTSGKPGRTGLRLAGGQEILTRLLVGADGANSFVREAGGFRLRQWDYGHEAIVTTVKTEKPHQYTAWQRFMRTGPLAFLPLHLPGIDAGSQCYSAIVWSCVTESAEGINELDDGAFMQRLGEAFEFRLGRVLETEMRTAFPLWQRHATDYVQDHIALVGDAAHTIHPLAGQGVNLGFADVQALADVVVDAVNRGEDFASHQVLSRYQRRRKAANLGMMAAMEGFKHLFGADDLVLKWLRNTGLRLTDRTPMVKRQLMRQAMGY